MAMRINARLDDDTARKMQVLIEHSSGSQTDIIKLAINLAYDQFEAQSHEGLTSLLDSPFLGSFSADPHLSECYKHLINEALDARYPPN
ncbi:MAG: hypothetical protein IPM37_15560 [Hahellaceae bacterium]|nr:hypothetical protein [Hahellaceae bacterium]